MLSKIFIAEMCTFIWKVNMDQAFAVFATDVKAYNLGILNNIGPQILSVGIGLRIKYRELSVLGF